MKTGNVLRLPLLIAISAFSLSMVLLWATHVGEINHMIMVVGISYASICFLFLVFQIWAFVRSHLVYDEDIEEVKMRVFDAERTR
jgi:hypothetical protein